MDSRPEIDRQKSWLRRSDQSQAVDQIAAVTIASKQSSTSSTLKPPSAAETHSLSGDIKLHAYSIEMSASKDKSKVHKLSLKGKHPPLCPPHTRLTSNRIGKACGRIRESTIATAIFDANLFSLNTLSTPSCKLVLAGLRISSLTPLQVPTRGVSSRGFHNVSLNASHTLGEYKLTIFCPVSRSMA